MGRGQPVSPHRAARPSSERFERPPRAHARGLRPRYRPMPPAGPLSEGAGGASPPAGRWGVGVRVGRGALPRRSGPRGCHEPRGTLQGRLRRRCAVARARSFPAPREPRQTLRAPNRRGSTPLRPEPWRRPEEQRPGPVILRGQPRARLQVLRAGKDSQLRKGAPVRDVGRRLPAGPGAGRRGPTARRSRTTSPAATPGETSPTSPYDARRARQAVTPPAVAATGTQTAAIMPTLLKHCVSLHHRQCNALTKCNAIH